MRKAGLFLTAIGFSGFLIGASGIDGQTVAGNMAMTVCCGAVTIAGYRIFLIASKKAKIMQMKKKQNRNLICSQKKKVRRNKNQTWKTWIQNGTIEGETQ